MWERWQPSWRPLIGGENCDAQAEMLRPPAIAVIGGLGVSMLLSLIVTPVVYFLLTRNRAREAVAE